MQAVTTSRLPNGVRLISRAVPGARSVSVGLWLHNGSRHEAPAEHGYAHLMEHLFFKGAGDWDAGAIARLTDRWGGQINAHTGRELTALHGLVPADQLAELVDLLVAMLTDTRFDQADVAAEQGVVLQEMAAVEDAADEAAEERAVALAWPDHPLGRPILGSRKSIRATRADTLHAYRRSLLQGERLLVVAVGAVEHAALEAACRPLAALPAGEPAASVAPVFHGGRYRERRRGQQAHLLWLLPAPGIAAPEYPAAVLANHILGGGVSSRLFQEVRERRGLVYDIYSNLECYADAGLWSIQTACDPDQAETCREAVESVLGELAAQGPSAEELSEALDHVRAAILLEHDVFSASMDQLAHEAFYLGRHLSLDERLERLRRVDAAAIRTLLGGACEAPLQLSWQP